jgi:hypothetical protein
MLTRRGLIAGAGLSAFPAMGAQAAASDEVQAEDFDTFWLWAGVRSQAVLSTARTLYVLQGQIEPRGLVAQGRLSPGPLKPRLWLSYRVHTLDWGPQVLPAILGRMARWKKAGAEVVGVQLDFDARSHHLDAYAAFLQALKPQLPQGCALSITGLLDWAAQGDAKTLNGLGEVVDEVVIQTYQGRRTIETYQAYSRQFEAFRFPFRIGLVQHGRWSPPAGLANSPWFRGYVVFLVN